MLSGVIFTEKPVKISSCNNSCSACFPCNVPDNGILCLQNSPQVNIKELVFKRWNILHQKASFVAFLSSTACTKRKKKLLCLYAIAFREFVLIKVDSYTCWIKRNIMMMYSRCIIYNGWPGRATIPEVMCLLIHYIRQISGSVWRLFCLRVS